MMYIYDDALLLLLPTLRIRRLVLCSFTSDRAQAEEQKMNIGSSWRDFTQAQRRIRPLPYLLDIMRPSDKSEKALP